MRPNELQDLIDKVARMARRRLGVRGRTAEIRLTRAARLMPADLRRDMQFLADAAPMALSPKLSHMVEGARAERAAAAVMAHLRGVDRGRERSAAMLRWAGWASFYALLAVGAVAFIALGRGLV
jgi:hypothetical protein